MGPIESSIREKLVTEFSPSHFEVENESHGHARNPQGETHFRILLVSDVFKGLSRVDRQRKVMSLLSGEMQRGLHAVSLRALTPQEWQAQGSQEFVSPMCSSGANRKI